MLYIWLFGCIGVQHHFTSLGHIMAVSDAHVFLGFLTPVLTQLSFLSQRLLFSHASAEVRGENLLERKFASNVYQTRNNQVMSPIRTPLSHLGGGFRLRPVQNLLPYNHKFISLYQTTKCWTFPK